MTPFTKLTAIAAPLPQINVDTDMIIPKLFLRTIKRTGLSKGLFYELRFDMDGKEIPDFVLNREPYRHAKILIAGDNFGCGSSREHAPWALLDFGFTCIIAPSFGDIFYNNCFKNGILPIALPQAQIDVLMQAAEQGRELSIDLAEQKVICGNEVFHFEIDAFRKHCLINGLDDIGLTLEKENFITAFETADREKRPWNYQL
jgi:3-isopropylmalate/(R)-2-methylmalate dehydratase small subunit